MEVGSVGYHLALEYVRPPDDRRILPRVQLGVEFFPKQARLAVFPVVLDTGAEVSAFDGSLALRAGWTTRQIADRALRTELIYGIGSGRPISAYLHEVTCYFGSPTRFARMKLRVLLTPPNTLEFPVLGRSDFFEQVDVTFVEFEKRLYFRFRNPEAIRESI